MLPEALGPAENPDEFLPQSITELELNGQTLAVYQARSSNDPFKRSNIVSDKIMPRLALAEGKTYKPNNLNRIIQEYRIGHGMLTAGFNITRMIEGADKVPMQTAKCAKKHSPVQ